MPDAFGAITIPQAEPDDEEGLDPTLYRLGQYLKAALNATLGAAWQSIAPNVPVVREAFTHSPEDVDFNERDLPALYLVRQGNQGPGFEWLAEDYDLQHTKLRLLWIFPPTRQEFQRRRNDFTHSLEKAVVAAIEAGRHPAYVMPGDPDPTAAARGTVILRAAGIHAIDWVGYKATQAVTVKMAPPAEPRSYYCLDAELHLVERHSLSLDDYAPSQSAPRGPGTGAGLDLTVTTPDLARDLAVAKT